MRITGGSALGRKLITPKGGHTIRPTSDKVREALFTVLGMRIQGSRILDLFAGTGALGIEGLSRGADFALFVDSSMEAGRLIEANLRTCFKQPRAAFIRLDLRFVSSLSFGKVGLTGDYLFDLVFMDPPYQKKLAKHVLMVLETTEILHPDALIVVEEHRDASLPSRSGALVLIDQRCYGETGLWFYRRQQL